MNGLPQQLTDTIHLLAKQHPVNLIVDAAMLELPNDKLRADVARAFLPKEERRVPAPSPRVKRVSVLLDENDVELHREANFYFPSTVEYVAEDGTRTIYIRDHKKRAVSSNIISEIGPGAESIDRGYYRKLESAPVDGGDVD